MAINAADARQLAAVIISAYGEDCATVAAILAPLRAQWPTIDWMVELTTVANQNAAFLASGLSIDWWLAEVDRRSLS